MGSLIAKQYDNNYYDSIDYQIEKTYENMLNDSLNYIDIMPDEEFKCFEKLIPNIYNNI